MKILPKILKKIAKKLFNHGKLILQFSDFLVIFFCNFFIRFSVKITKKMSKKYFKNKKKIAKIRQNYKITGQES